jgi:ubiquinone/menaquinone biosynthesis C-methylase UbiE
MELTDAFSRFEFAGWERVASRYDAAWSGLTRLFVPPLLDALRLRPGAWLLDVACGPGYVAQAARRRGAMAIGVDFSPTMVEIAARFNPKLQFHTGDAQALQYESQSFDAVAMNFGVLHLAAPELAFAEAARVLRPRGRYAFTLWAGPEQSPGMKIVADAIAAHADMNVKLPEGPAYFSYESAAECSPALQRAGFDVDTLEFKTITAEWAVPRAEFVFEAERDAGVRVAAVLAAQHSTTLNAIRDAVVVAAQPYARGDGFLLPFAAHVVAVSVT